MPDEHVSMVASMPFELMSFLEGPTLAWGVFEDRFGTLRRRIRVRMDGRWQDGEFVLDEWFDYDSGPSERRIWRIIPGSEGGFTATCPECVGEATGLSDDGSIRMRYRFRLEFSGRSLVVDLDDRIHRLDAGIAVSRARISKWGIQLGELSLFLSKPGATVVGDPPGAAAEVSSRVRCRSSCPQ